MTTVNVPRTSQVIYPDSDGKPMGETPRHVRVLIDSYETLDVHFQDDPDIFIAADMFLYYVKGQPSKNVSPDVFWCKGVPKNKVPERRTYKLWEERGVGPDWILEVTSKSTRHEDTQIKFHLYQDILKVKEYFLFDPFEEFLQPPLVGYRLHRGRYAAIKWANRRLSSKVLGLELEIHEDNLRFFDPTTGQRLLTPREAAQQAKAALDRLRRQIGPRSWNGLRP